MRSTSPGRLSSSHDFSIGRSISLTRSSSVRALLLSTVLARVLKADSTADTVERDRICCGGGAAGLSSSGGSNAGCRCTARAAAVSVNSRSFSGSILWNEACGSGSAISSVSSNTSPSGKGGLISAGVVASSRPLSNASMSSWLWDAAGAAACGAAGGGAGLTGGAAAFATAACAAGTADGGMSFITGALAPGAATAGFSGFAGAATAGLEGFSAVGGFASSSAMMRRIDAKISSIEGSWTFAGCVISDSTSSTPSHAFYTKHDKICRFRICRPGFSSHNPDLSPDQAPSDTSRGVPPLLGAPKRRGRRYWMRCESLCCLKQRYGTATIDCKQRAVGTPSAPSGAGGDIGGSAAVGSANAVPAVTHLMIVHAGVIDRGGEIEHLRRQPPYVVQDRIGRDHAVMLRGDERDTGVDQRLLSVEHVERGALPGLGLFTNAVERDLRSRHLRLRRGDLRLARHQLAPCRHNVGAGLVPRLFGKQALLRQGFLRLADQRVFGAALIDRDRKLRDRGSAERPEDCQGLFVGLLHRTLQRHRRQQRAFVDLGLEIADVDPEHRGGDVRILRQAEIDRAGQRSRQEAIDRRSRRKILRLVAGDAAGVSLGRGWVGFGG